MATTALDQKRSEAEKVIRQIKEKCQGSFISRDKVGELTGGAISSRYCANLDSIDQGPKGAFRVGRKKCYPIDAFCDWLISRLEV